MTTDLNVNIRNLRGAVPTTAFVFLLSVAPAFAAATPAPGDKSGKALAEPFIQAEEVEKAGEPWERHVKRLIIESKISGGIVENETPLQKRPEKSKTKRPKFSGREMLDVLASQNRGYKWQTTAGTINVIPLDIAKGSLSPLEKPAARFSLRARHATVAIQALLKREKIPVQFETRNILGGIRPKTIPEERDFTCEAKAVLQCMNEFAAQDGTLFWHLYFHKRLQSYVISSSDDKEVQ